jgi:uncharacterized membrane protein
MKKYKKIEILVVLAFIIYFIILTALEVNNLFKSNNISLEGIDSDNNVQLISFFTMIIAISFVIVLLKNIFLIVIFFGIKFGLKKFKKSNLNSDDENNYKDYYRDILKGYNPAVLSFIDLIEVTLPNSLISILLNLKAKGKIEVTDKLNIIDENQDDLDNIEKYVINNIQEGNLKKLNVYEYKKIVELEAANLKLVESDLEIKKRIIKSIISLIFGYSLFNYIIDLVQNITNVLSNNNEILSIVTTFIFMVITVISFVYPFYNFIYLITFAIKKIGQPFVRSNKGIELNRKLEGLKNYLIDFSDIQNDSSQSLAIWDDYLIYSVIFGHNKVVVEEYSKFVQ